jgi:hypothetical protein
MRYLKDIGYNKHGYGYPDERSNYNARDKQHPEFYILLFIEQVRNSIRRVKIIIDGDKGQITKLYSDGMGKHQRAIPENKDPEKVSQQPKTNVI